MIKVALRLSLRLNTRPIITVVAQLSLRHQSRLFHRLGVDYGTSPVLRRRATWHRLNIRRLLLCHKVSSNGPR